DGREIVLPAPDEDDVVVQIGRPRVVATLPAKSTQVFIVVSDTPITEALRKSLREITMGTVDTELRRRIYQGIASFLGQTTATILPVDLSPDAQKTQAPPTPPEPPT
ncbi:MAG: hypothetical protein AB7I30_09190, partial [Isosphaeraceae bacterium]